MLLLLLAAACAAAPAQEAPSTLVVTGPRAVFFSLSRTERDSIARSEGLEIDDVLDDFNLEAGRAAVALGRLGIRTEFTECSTVVVRIGARIAHTFDRRALGDPVGMILFDGVHDPRYYGGQGTEADMIQEAREYFHIRGGGDDR
jgi:hypothetical protein